jgi:two-component sensor histidine kinase/CheY-like chemotaxis protein
MKIVMVDDSPGDRRLCRVLLAESLGQRLEFWEESAALPGLETCRAVGPDCILLDYKLPDMDGLEFLVRLQAGGPNFAVVMLTGLADQHVAIRAMKAGAQEYLFKDRITPEALLQAIETANEKVGLMRALKRERDRLAASLAEKEVLLREVHHRVKNNLQVIASLLRLQANAFPDSSFAEAVRESQNRVESMAMIHEQLYETENLREVDLARHASLLLTNLFHSYAVDPARISGWVSIEPMTLAVDRAIPAGLILNELISNALKHAFPGRGSGSLWVEGANGGGRVVLSVRDDGIGMPQASWSKGLGLEIVNILTVQLRGKLEMISNQGTTFRISFPNG